MDLKVECQKTEANQINAPGTFIHCMVKTPGTNRIIVARLNERRHNVKGRRSNGGWSLQLIKKHTKTKDDDSPLVNLMILVSFLC